ncbi:uncharacterized protein LOC114720772 [Neltuma alba]|uniref:uncharacterized protein LOC114720772 n=1 Tax=Neltuma alba TaxID=207710 RepID=UPI0010A385BE|nr:uncharacterized protein LOC114720772 [Prosopis alba]
MDMKGTVDVSCYLRFEATGDSEASCDPIKDPNIACRISICDDDDAQSCCYDSSESVNSDQLINGYEPDEKRIEDEDEEEVCVYGTTYREEEEEDDDDDDCEIQVQKKVRVCGDSGPKKMDEMEKNRLFWEACLAS